MDYTDNVEQASEYLRIALPLLNKHGIPPNPIHYAVWYAYASGQNSKLTNAINQAIEAKGSVSAEMSHALYKKHIQNHDAVSMQVHEGVNKVMEALTDQLINSSDQAMHYEEVLGSFDKELGLETRPDHLQDVVKNLSEETQVMQTVNKDLTQKLNNSSSELITLKKELDEARKAANTDILTGIPNRQAFESRIALCIKEQTPFCLLLADIDFFKKFNDNYGHQLGDKILRFVAQTIQKHLKGQDMATRFGGEEFAIILPETPFGGAMAVAENLRKIIQQQKLRRTDSKEYIDSITLSIGVGMYRPGEPGEDLIERADTALYQAKKNGRNCVTPEEPFTQTA